MSVKIVQDNYGKSRVRLMKVARNGEHHELQNLTVNIAIEGDFDTIHTVGDNSLCLPTDTMKNTVYALAGQTQEIEDVEAFGRRLTEHFLKNNPQISLVRIDLFEHFWKRMKFDETPHPHSFVKGSDEKRTARITTTHENTIVESGVEDLIVLKTTGSGFAGYIKDEYTTLPETTDRIFSTAIKGVWRYKNADAATKDNWQNIRQTILSVFSAHDSLSVQHTLYAMGEDILNKFADVEEVYFSLPNIHCLPVDISRFGLENDNRIFVPTDEPHGLIEARLSR
ncbi:MAG TPA: urate oxidase [Pyrinomonadaceae bacterium]|jgi:urate oxidase|nr:urate oxidase [Pyrinomonadaceae bacterium]